ELLAAAELKVSKKEEPFVYLDSPLLMDVQLPKKGNPLNRVMAGAFDGYISAVIGYASAFTTYKLTDLNEGAESVFVSVSLASWALRDTFADQGSRSLGKKLFRLEITHWDGSLPSQTATALRSWYLLMVPLAYL